jgi:uncharacterized LabA/DUF88 family protein
VTIENTRSEHNGWQEPGVEQLSVSENSALPTNGDAFPGEKPPVEAEVQPDTTLPEPVVDGEKTDHNKTEQQELLSPTLSSSEQETQPGQDFSFNPLIEVANEQFAPAAAVSELPDAFAGEAPVLFTLEQETPLTDAELVRPFTDFIEEFRQTEVRLNTFLQESETAPFVSFAEDGNVVEPVASELTQIVDLVAEIQPQEQLAEIGTENEQELLRINEEIRPGLTQPSLSSERPVSPLLRPATRIRLPRHGRHRIEELIQPAELHADVTKPEIETLVEEKSEPETSQIEEQPARPPRRYRFDRPATAKPLTDRPASASLSAAKPPTLPTPARIPEVKEKRSATFVTHIENGLSAEPITTRPGNNGVSHPAPEAPVLKVVAPEPVTPVAEVHTPPPAERRRRSNHERQREKEQTAPVVVPVPEIVVPEPEPVASVLELPIEDLPPLEYAELQAANSRRRRRRRTGSVGPVPASNGLIAPKAVLPELPIPAPMPAPLPPAIALPKSSPAAPVMPPAANANANYNIVSGYTVSQMNQGNDASGPFMGPEPSPARGSTFGSTTPQIRPVRNEALRAPGHTTKHVSDPLMTPASVSHLGNVVAQAIQTQTDRMVSELRRANQVPTNISVSLPPFPSNERVGVFVDVANLLYSARTLRMTVDFGKLLDFLRGNRRLVRAQAYCPTSPQPGDDQMFLQAVKGLGYRITTKNYKTFSSGAKKADLDLDLCMDVVRLVDGKAVDCIVLVSGDSDFMPMLDYCSDHGVRVEVAAFDESMSATLRQGCDLFVNLSMLEEIRA